MTVSPPPPAPTPTTTTTTTTLSAFAYEDIQLNQAMLFSVLMVAVIVGGMRTTRRATLQLLNFSAGDLWGKMWTYSPHRYLWAGVKKALPPAVRSRVRSAVKRCLRVVLGRSALKKTTARHKHSLRHGHGHSHGERSRRLNSTVRRRKG
ncbi:uncharacterized protein LOC118478065 [Aplysia californica]|uniref:Uncharacterized protein LOC118478065 n=1 Tax=Aplysia californica TaxID=6500 RepID=A0ABM1VWW6_APLCA|nr:uncharacterized protein LOC118478065 [Aplysia californica]